MTAGPVAQHGNADAAEIAKWMEEDFKSSPAEIRIEGGAGVDRALETLVEQTAAFDDVSDLLTRAVAETIAPDTEPTLALPSLTPYLPLVRYYRGTDAAVSLTSSLKNGRVPEAYHFRVPVESTVRRSAHPQCTTLTRGRPLVEGR